MPGRTQDPLTGKSLLVARGINKMLGLQKLESVFILFKTVVLLEVEM